MTATGTRAAADELHVRGLGASFRDEGYVAVPLFSERECRDLLARLQEPQPPPLDWGKGCAATSYEHYALATDDRILDLVTSLLGDDVLLWSARLVARGPGAVHRWHTDIETSSPEAETLSVWIGLANTNARSSLQVVPFSHRFGTTLQEVAARKGEGRAADGDADVATWAREQDSRSDVVALAMENGEALLFDGRLWHGSHNLNQHARRYAALLQYATPRTAIRIPNLQRLDWPFESFQIPRAPCIVVSGHDPERVNRLVRGPASSDDRALPALSSRIHALSLPLEQDPDRGWKPHHMFRGATADLRAIKCHVSVLDPGRQPHPPHRHEDEEILTILEGEADLVLEEPTDPQSTRPHRVGRGTFAFYPRDFAHTIRNASDAPVTYAMFKWKTQRNRRRPFLGHRLVACAEELAAMPGDDPSGWSTKAVLDGETAYLRHLHAHISTLEPGAGYPAHVDAYDVCMVVLEGTVETLGQQIGAPGLVFCAAGEPHGMRAVGDRPAVYVVFELRGRHATRHPPDDRGAAQRVRGRLRDLRLLGRAWTDRVRAVLGSVARRRPRG